MTEDLSANVCGGPTTEDLKPEIYPPLFVADLKRRRSRPLPCPVPIWTSRRPRWQVKEIIDNSRLAL
jgi:hypothetical protein